MYTFINKNIKLERPHKIKTALDNWLYNCPWEEILGNEAKNHPAYPFIAHIQKDRQDMDIPS